MTIQNFLSDLTGNGALPAITAMNIQAAILLHRATLLSGKWSPREYFESSCLLACSLPPTTVMQPQQFNSYMTACTSLDRRTTQFIAALPPVAQFYHHSSPSARTMLVTHALAVGAVIRLHTTFSLTNADSQRRCLAAAQTVLRTVADTRVPDFTCAGPMLGTLCMAACQVLIEEVARIRAGPASQSGVLGMAAGGLEASLRAEIARGIATMEVFAVGSPLIRGCSPSAVSFMD